MRGNESKFAYSKTIQLAVLRKIGADFKMEVEKQLLRAVSSVGKVKDL